MINIGKVIGDVIEAGGVKNVTYNYYGKDEAGRGAGGEADCLISDDDIPEALRSDEAGAIMGRLVDAGLIDDGWQPVGLSGPEKGLVAREASRRLGIAEVWQVFGRLWDMKPETLRGYYNKAFEQRKSLTFQDRLKNALD